VDLNVVRMSYEKARQPLPDLVKDTVETYYRRNMGDIESSHNSTLTEIKASSLCRTARRTVLELFPGVDCNDRDLKIGRNRYYERYLIDQNEKRGRPLNVVQIRIAILRMNEAEYRLVRCNLTNIGSVKADNVTIRIPPEFSERHTNEDTKGTTFSLAPNETYHRLFETVRGLTAADPHTESQFGVDWTRAQGLPGTGHAQTSMIVILLLMVILLVAAVIRDLLSTPLPDPNSPDDELQSLLDKLDSPPPATPTKDKPVVINTGNEGTDKNSGVPPAPFI
jgi:hypothetical protein